jgi:hypothetical protein
MRLLALTVWLFLPGSLSSQTTPDWQLRARAGTLSAEFSDITSIRELADGRVLITDRREGRLVVADFPQDQVTDIGRRGSGPGEYQALYRLLALRGDSTLIADIPAGRWLLLDGARVVATLPPDTPAIRVILLGMASSADERGYVLGIGRQATGPLGEGSDSSAAVLVHRLSGHILERIPLRNAPPLPREVRGQQVRVFRQPFRTPEEALLFRDGWLAVARFAPYRVDWRTPEGRWLPGRALAADPVPLTAREKDAYVRRNSWAGRATEWPKVVPPFESGALLPTPEGWLLIARVPTADHPEQRYDVIDRAGMLRAHLILTPSQRIVGFGRAVVYVVAEDSDGIQRLARHPWQ